MKRNFLIWSIPLALAFLFVLFGVLPRIRNQQELQAAVQREKGRVPQVKVVAAAVSSDTSRLTLPGQIQPFRETALFARTQGFLKKRLADIGSRVRAGQLLAIIDAPELDQDLDRARADQLLAKANLERTRSVTLPGAIAQQDIDSREAAYAMNTAGVRRLEALKRLQEIRAPFPGVITSRRTEVGALVNAGSTTPLFTLSQVDTLRVLVDVPQAYYRSISLGQPVEVRIPEIPGRVFKGQVVRTAGALSAHTRTLLTEVVIPNREQELVAGLYGQVSFQVRQATPPVIIPANALLIQAAGPQVLVVDPDNSLRLQPVEISRDFGTRVEISGGLKGGEHLVVNPTDNLREGQQVQPQPSAPVSLSK